MVTMPITVQAAIVPSTLVQVGRTTPVPATTITAAAVTDVPDIAENMLPPGLATVRAMVQTATYTITVEDRTLTELPPET